MKVRANSIYRYEPTGLDIFDPPYGARAGFLKRGDFVRVVNLPGCPKANTMGQAHIEKGDDFAGLVSTASLVPADS